ncbi:MAG: DUF2070 family protein [Candidatus Thermoplasmatota archaeon]|nr:DUF2070 family protein [Candidatus Thermoplasmatota archaeon]
MGDETNPLQASMERSAKIGELFFPSPPRSLSYVAILLFTLAATALLGADLSALGDATLLVLLPALASAMLDPIIVQLARGTFYHRRSAGLAALGAAFTATGLLLAVVLGLLRVQAGMVLYVTVGFVWVLRFGVFHVLVDDRSAAALALSSVQPLVALGGLLPLYGDGILPIGLILWTVLLAPLLLMIRVFEAPLQRNFGISSTKLFRSYLDHLTTQSVDAEELLERLGEPIQARVSVFVFRRKDGSKKAAVVVPGVHPGPFGALGGGDLPAKMRAALQDWEHVLVPHAAADHDLNPVSSQEVDRLGHYASELAENAETSTGGSRFTEAGETVRVGCQLFGQDAFLTYTSWPEAIDDVDWGVGRASELIAQAHGARQAVFADCHNSLRASSGAVFPLTPRALAIEELSGEAAAGCIREAVDELQVGLAQDRSLGLGHLIGRAGCQALVVQAGDQRTAYVLWDGNNMVPEATQAIRQAVLEVVDEVRVMTTDNHAVNLEGGVYSPVGLRTSHGTLAQISQDTVKAALEDLEPVEAGTAIGHAPDIQVVGHQKTAQLSASVNVMVAIVPELVVAILALWTLGVTTVFLAF